MSTNIIPFGPQASNRVPAAFAGTNWREQNDAAMGGISQGFGVLSIRGKVFRVKVRGEEKPILTREGDPVASINVVALAANANVSKIYYENGYDDGSAAAPDCFSTDGVAPDPAVQKKQSASCATCKWNVWGSKVTPNGTKVQACANSKRIALVPALRVDENNPYDDAAAEAVLRNEVYGGPLLLRLPGSALAEWAKFTQLCNSYGVPFYAAVARLRFDPSVAYPRPIFEGARMLSDHESMVVRDLQSLPIVGRIINETSEVARDTSGSAVAMPQTMAPPPIQPALVAPPPPVPVEAAPPPPPPVVVAPPPPPPPPAEEPFQFTPDGKHRWRPGMAAWEPVPATPPAPVAAPVQAAPPAPVQAALAPPPTPVAQAAPEPAQAAPVTAAPAIPATGPAAAPPELDQFLSEMNALTG